MEQEKLLKLVGEFYEKLSEQFPDEVGKLTLELKSNSLQSIEAKNIKDLKFGCCFYVPGVGVVCVC